MNTFQFTLRAARFSSGYSVKEVAEYCDVSVHTIRMYEKDSGTLPLHLILKLSFLYGVSFDLIYVGTETNCIIQNREIAQAREFKHDGIKEAV